jgi:hypothetical protein
MHAGPKLSGPALEKRATGILAFSNRQTLKIHLVHWVAPEHPGGQFPENTRAQET